MTIVNDVLCALQAPRHCLAHHWARFQIDLPTAWSNAGAEWLAWLLVRVGYSYEEVTSVVTAHFAMEAELDTKAINAHNIVARFMQKTGIDVADLYRSRFVYEEVVAKLAVAIAG